ncbi:MAG: flagellar basal body P-ring formation chaperone FlgA [Pseudomonadota bacterium]
MRWRAFISLTAILLAPSATAETIIASRTIRAQEIILSTDLKIIDDTIAGMASRKQDVAGMEARRIIYAGRPIPLGDIGPPALIDRNQVIPLAFRVNGLTIKTEGRALARGGFGDRIRVINLESRTTISGRIDETGTVWVGE